MSAWIRSGSELLMVREEIGTPVDPCLKLLSWPLSPKFFWRFLPVDKAGGIPEYVYVRPIHTVALNQRYKYPHFIFQWNSLWESGHVRRELLNRDAPKSLRWLLQYEADVRLVERGADHSYDAYAPLYHLLSRATLDRFGLPYLKRTIWPHAMSKPLLEQVMPIDFDQRLEQAFTYHVWSSLGCRGAPSCFTQR